MNRYDELAKRNVLLIEAAFDTVAPPEKMLKPLAAKLEELHANVSYESIQSNHSFVGQRMKLTRLVGEWIEKIYFLDEGGHDDNPTSAIGMLAPVSVHADYFRQGIGVAMHQMGIENVKEFGSKGITVEGNYIVYDMYYNA